MIGGSEHRVRPPECIVAFGHRYAPTDHLRIADLIPNEACGQYGATVDQAANDAALRPQKLPMNQFGFLRG